MSDGTYLAYMKAITHYHYHPLSPFIMNYRNFSNNYLHYTVTRKSEPTKYIAVG